MTLKTRDPIYVLRYQILKPINPNTVAEGFIEDSVNEKIKTARKIQGELAVSESTGVKSLNAVCNSTSGITANESFNLLSQQSNTPIICFKIKNPPTVHSTSKIQPTTSPTFVFSASASVRKKWGYERRLLNSRFVRSSSCFLFSFYYFTQKV
jgi:hypothetical protein